MAIRYRSAQMFILILVALFALTALGFAQVQVPAGTKVRVAFTEKVSSGSAKVGDKVPIKLVDSIVVGGISVVKAGATGTATVKKVQPAGKPGKPGSIEVELGELDAKGFYNSPDNRKLALAGPDGPLVAKGGNKKIISFILGFGLLIKGGQGVIPANQPMDAQVKETILLMP